MLGVLSKVGFVVWALAARTRRVGPRGPRFSSTPEDGLCLFASSCYTKVSLGACTVANPSADISRVSGVTARNVIRIACVSRALRSVVILGLTFHTLPVQQLLPLFRVLPELDIAREVVQMCLYSW